ncbi:MAG: hypothetical protein E8D42_01775 [Nitrospira sp.]|nr:MAG: hypothetical protein E8D42_01775 [Nitrospira sp.]
MGKKRARPGYLTQYAKHAGISLASASEALRRVGIDYMEPFDFTDADLRRKAARHADRMPLSHPIYGQAGEETAPDKVSPNGADRNDPNFGSFSEAQARERHYKAKLAELEYLELVGQLVRKDKVEEEAFRKWRVARDKMLNLVNRIHNELATETDPIKVKKKLLLEIRQAMESIAVGVDPWKEVA